MGAMVGTVRGVEGTAIEVEAIDVAIEVARPGRYPEADTGGKLSGYGRGGYRSRSYRSSYRSSEAMQIPRGGHRGWLDGI